MTKYDFRRKKILVACEESQAVTVAFRRLGHEAYSCDITPCSGNHPEWHIMGDCLPLLNGRCKFETMNGESHEIEGKWDIIIAHPPCTYLTKASACRLYKTAGAIDPERMQKAVSARLFFQRFLDADCDRVCIENPTPLKVRCLPPPTQVIQPYEYGHPYSKRTCLWLRGLPHLVPTDIQETCSPWMPSNTGKFARGGGGARGHVHNSKEASKTFAGIAAAMAEQWGSE